MKEYYTNISKASRSSCLTNSNIYQTSNAATTTPPQPLHLQLPAQIVDAMGEISVVPNVPES